MNGVRNTSSVIKCPNYLPSSRKMKRLQNLGELKFSDFAFSDIPKELRFMFHYPKIRNEDPRQAGNLEAKECRFIN